MSQPTTIDKLVPVFRVLGGASLVALIGLGLYREDQPKPATTPIEPPTGFVEISPKAALEKAGALSSCYVKQWVIDPQNQEMSEKGMAGLKKTWSFDDAMTLKPMTVAIDGRGRDGQDCSKFAAKMADHSTRYPSYLLKDTAAGPEVVVVYKWDKVYAPKP